MAGTARVVKRQWSLHNFSVSAQAQVFERAVYDNIRDIITDLEVLRAHQAGVNVLLDADTTNTTYVGDSGASDPINVASDLIAATFTTPELDD